MLSDVSVIHPAALAFCSITVILMLFLPRKYTFAPFILAALIIPLQQRVVIAGLDFTLLRVMIIFGLARVSIRSEYKWLTLNLVDRAMILWVLARILSYTLLFQTFSALIYRLGGTLDALGVYFLARILVRDLDDIERVVKALVAVCVVVGVAMLTEQTTQRNLFSVFGGVPAVTALRQGALRSQGPFAHPILAGTLGATLVPIFWSLRLRHRKAAILGLFAAIAVIGGCSSSGPVLVGLAGLLGLSTWMFREHMRVIRWGIVVTIVSLQLIMTAPVWGLLWRLSIFGGSTGFHRFYLFDAFLKRFSEWWLLGTESTAHWGYYLFDVTNMYVRVGVEGGLITLMFFLLIIFRCFQSIGLAIPKFEADPPTQKLFWALGVSLFAHVVNFMGVDYWDQSVVLWYWLLAMISVVSTLPNGLDEGTQEAERTYIPNQRGFLSQPI